MPEPTPKLLSYGDPRVARDYDRRWASARGRRRNRRKARAIERALALLERAQGTRLARVLDAPCGNGRFTDLLERPGYTGVELSGPMLREARRRHPHATYVRADLGRLPFDDGAVDAVVCVRFLHLVPDPSARVAYLAEAARVARLGVVADYRHDRTLRVRGRRLRHRLGLYPERPSNPSPAMIDRELLAAGLVPLARVRVRPAPWLSDKVLVAALPASSPATSDRLPNRARG